ncbi:MAG: hypothetical protein V4485_03675 [Pseudomonadota bacterium]
MSRGVRYLKWINIAFAQNVHDGLTEQAVLALLDTGRHSPDKTSPASASASLSVSAHTLTSASVPASSSAPSSVLSSQAPSSGGAGPTPYLSPEAPVGVDTSARRSSLAFELSDLFQDKFLSHILELFKTDNIRTEKLPNIGEHLLFSFRINDKVRAICTTTSVEDKGEFLVVLKVMEDHRYDRTLTNLQDSSIIDNTLSSLNSKPSSNGDSAATASDQRAHIHHLGASPISIITTSDNKVLVLSKEQVSAIDRNNESGGAKPSTFDYYIINGLAGSGKTSIAEGILDKAHSCGLTTLYVTKSKRLVDSVSKEFTDSTSKSDTLEPEVAVAANVPDSGSDSRPDSGSSESSEDTQSPSFYTYEQLIAPSLMKYLATSALDPQKESSSQSNSQASSPAKAKGPKGKEVTGRGDSMLKVPSVPEGHTLQKLLVLIHREKALPNDITEEKKLELKAFLGSYLKRTVVGKKQFADWANTNGYILELPEGLQITADDLYQEVLRAHSFDAKYIGKKGTAHPNLHKQESPGAEKAKKGANKSTSKTSAAATEAPESIAQKILKSYLNYLNHNKLIDPSFEKVTPSNADQKYELVVVDEAQGLSRQELDAIAKTLTKDGKLHILRDGNQSLEDPFDTLSQSMHEITSKNPTEVSYLSTSYRTPETVTNLANLLLKIKAFAIGGKLHKQDLGSYSSSKAHAPEGDTKEVHNPEENDPEHFCSKSDKRGHVEIVEELKSELIDEVRNNIIDSVVVALQEDQLEEARQAFNGAIVLTAKDAAGLEWKKVVVYDPFNEATGLQDKALFSRYNPNIQPPSNFPKEQDLRDGLKFVPPLNALFVALTRATSDLVLYIPQEQGSGKGGKAQVKTKAASASTIFINEVRNEAKNESNGVIASDKNNGIKLDKKSTNEVIEYICQDNVDPTSEAGLQLIQSVITRLKDQKEKAATDNEDIAKLAEYIKANKIEISQNHLSIITKILQSSGAAKVSTSAGAPSQSADTTVQEAVLKECRGKWDTWGYNRKTQAIDKLDGNYLEQLLFGIKDAEGKTLFEEMLEVCTPEPQKNDAPGLSDYIAKFSSCIKKLSIHEQLSKQELGSILCKITKGQPILLSIITENRLLTHLPRLLDLADFTEDSQALANALCFVNKHGGSPIYLMSGISAFHRYLSKLLDLADFTSKESKQALAKALCSITKSGNPPLYLMSVDSAFHRYLPKVLDLADFTSKESKQALAKALCYINKSGQSALFFMSGFSELRGALCKLLEAADFTESKQALAKALCSMDKNGTSTLYSMSRYYELHKYLPWLLDLADFTSKESKQALAKTLCSVDENGMSPLYLMSMFSELHECLPGVLNLADFTSKESKQDLAKALCSISESGASPLYVMSGNEGLRDSLSKLIKTAVFVSKEAKKNLAKALCHIDEDGQSALYLMSVNEGLQDSLSKLIESADFASDKTKKNLAKALCHIDEDGQSALYLMSRSLELHDSLIKLVESIESADFTSKEIKESLGKALCSMDQDGLSPIYFINRSLELQDSFPKLIGIADFTYEIKENLGKAMCSIDENGESPICFMSENPELHESLFELIKIADFTSNESKKSLNEALDSISTVTRTSARFFLEESPNLSILKYLTELTKPNTTTEAVETTPAPLECPVAYAAEGDGGLPHPLDLGLAADLEGEGMPLAGNTPESPA